MKVLRKVKSDKAHANTNIWSLKLLSTAILGCIASSAGHTTDLEIYQGATYGNASIMMMLDNSGSMDTRSIRNDYSAVLSGDSTTSGKLTQDLYDDKGVKTNQAYEYDVTYVKKGDTKYYDRMSRLKMALMPMFANPKSSTAFGGDVDLSKYRIGLGSFYISSGKNGGKIINPVLDLTLENRKKLLTTVKSLSASTNTPTADAYAEAGAYMLGTNTQKAETETETVYTPVGAVEHRSNNNKKYYLYNCSNVSSTTFTNNGNTHFYCGSLSNIGPNSGAKNLSELRLSDLGAYDSSKNITISSENGTLTYYYRAQTREVVSNSASGFSQSSDDTKVKPGLSKYDSPIKGEASQCDGYGVYFLTDGEPNTSTTDTINLMENSLAGSSLSMGGSCDVGLTSTGTTFGTASRWECIGEYSKYLYDKGNPKSTLIATATVGFGSVFKKLTDKGKITRTITRPSGVVENVKVYQCDADGIGQDAKNLCKLGEKGEGYGNGGFYYTEEPKDIADSVRKFIEDVSTADIDPISAGTMSVPLDSLGGLKSRQFAYLPILEPVPKSPLLWNGNLKKYKVENATLVGSNNNAVFSDSTGLFAQNTYDEWNTINSTSRVDTSRPDGGAPQVGGAYQKVFENATSPLVGNRNLFVDNGSGLTNLKVSQDKKPSNFDALTTENGYDNDQKLTLLNFMGYSEPTGTTGTIVTDDQALTSTQNKLLKNVGGVLHSIPQLITQKIEVDTSGQFDPSTREDYIIYGSMDGALHMLDDSTGKETFTFIPKQILDLQPAAIVGTGSAKDGSYPYGVDAPWLTYVSYTTKSTPTGTGDTATTTNTYESNQSLALGGLRMGGSMYYALDVSDVKKPKIIYGVGSNYANRLKGSADALGGTKNNITGASSDEQKAFAKMGQSWGKPTLGYVKSGGKKVMVSFLPGGYDTCYENPTFKLGTSYPSDAQCNNKSAAQGNALYMVQMGEVETKDNGEETVNTEKKNGKLLWWASNEGTVDDSTTRSKKLQYSKSADLKHSVVTQIRALDRNYDGLIDHLYFADLGGQVWRVDINNDEDTKNFKIDRVVKVLDVSDQAGNTDAPPRFYERPLITFYNGSYAYTDASNVVGSYSGVQAMVTVGTGDRSNPVTAERKTPDALYTVIDKDLTRTDLFDYKKGATSTISLHTPTIKVAGTSDKNDKLQELTFSDADIGATGIRQNMERNLIQGWYMPFSHWLGDDAAVSGKYKIKMFNEPDALASVLISSSFNPDEGQKIQACSAGVIGETQRERTCLPYGSCPDASGNETVTLRSTFNAGSGIVDNIISQYNDTSLFTSLTNTKNDSVQPTTYNCTGDDCDIKKVNLNVDKRINPLSWLED